MPEIKITGLREFQASLRQMDATLPRQLRLIFNDAMGLVIDYARPRMPSRSGAARASLKGKSGQRQARIALGGRGAPYTPWLDFGGQGRRSGRPPARPFRREGRYVYAGLAARRDDITRVMAEGLARLAKDAGLQVD